ncbi:MAG: 50S ribosomal protein L16 [Deltaproteobacteria bacterium]|nr:50S ribosomal protein L16 [Deltaproteobacteria bacterium]MBI4196472.1 50S ribosomal protein L16 [Deltaproteobacteria bacterium]
MLQPARLKFRKTQKGRVYGLATRGQYVSFGDVGLQSLERGLVTSRQIEACRLAMARFLKKGGKVFIRIFPDKPITKKPAETRMGKGKGAVEGWGCPIKPGRVLFEVGGLASDVASEALLLASSKLPVKTQLVTREKFRGI